MTDTAEQPPRAKPGQPVRGCGTVAAYRRHKKAGDPRCDACWAAWAAKMREQYAARQAKANRAPL